MSASSSSRSLARRRTSQPAPAIPLVGCPDYGLPVKVYVSGTKEHKGWTFYRCKFYEKTCNFWHWEREYVYHLVDTNVLRGDAAVEAIGWAEDRREELESELEKKKKLAEVWGRGARPCVRASSNNNQSDEMVMRDLLVVGREMVLLLKIGVAMLSVVMVLGVGIFLKK